MAFARLGRSTVACMLAAVLSACASSGNNFSSSGVSQLVAGETTFDQARNLLHGDPVIVYPQSDGTSMARWAYKTTVSTDAIYFNRELWLLFGPDGRFMRVLKSENVPLSKPGEDAVSGSTGDMH